MEFTKFLPRLQQQQEIKLSGLTLCYFNDICALGTWLYTLCIFLSYTGTLWSQCYPNKT